MKSETVSKMKATRVEKKVDTALSDKEQEVLTNAKAAKPAPLTPNAVKGMAEQKKSESGDTGYRYCYTLVTAEQKKVIDLRKYEKELTTLFKRYFSERLISLNITQHTYSFILRDEFKVGEKRMLGRSVGAIGNMKSYAKKVFYNNGQDFSTQLFKMQTNKKEKLCLI